MQTYEGEGRQSLGRAVFELTECKFWLGLDFRDSLLNSASAIAGDLDRSLDGSAISFCE